jgi:hypothetical protein
MQKPLLALTLLAACSSTMAAPAAPVAKPADTAVYELAARRAQMLGWLHDYREAGVYPVDAAGTPTSVFVDANGTRCPMAELVHKSGRDDLVAAVAKDNNTVRLADVREGPLFDWMLSSGLTLNEINLIQGAMNNDLSWMRFEIQEQANTILAAKAQVRGKLETAEMALRDSTGTSLAIAQKRIPATRSVDGLAHAPIVMGVVVPKPTPGELRARAAAQQQAFTQQIRRTRFGRVIQIESLN